MNEIRKEDILLKTLLGILILTAFTSGIKVGGESYGLTLSQIFAILIFVFLFVASAANQWQIPVFFTDWTSVFIYLYFASNLFSSILISPNKAQSLKGCVSILLYVLIYTTVRWLMKFMQDNQAVVRRLMKFNALSGIFGLSCMVISYLTGKENIGITYGQLGTAGIGGLEGSVPSIRSLALEPNMFSITAAAVLCLNLSVYLLWKKSAVQLITIALLSLAVLFAYTRSVYIGMGVAVLVLILLSGRVKLLISLANYFIALMLIGVVLYLALPDKSSVKIALGARISTLTDFTSGSGAGRLEGYRIGLEGFRESPLFGKGTFSAKTSIFNIYTNEEQERFGGHGWLTGLWIQSLHDTGIFGFIIVFSLFGSLFYANFKIFKRLDGANINKSIVLGFIGGNTVIIISSFLSSSLWISFPYIFWAINLSFLVACRKQMDEEALHSAQIKPAN